MREGKELSQNWEGLLARYSERRRGKSLSNEKKKASYMNPSPLFARSGITFVMSVMITKSGYYDVNVFRNKTSHVNDNAFEYVGTMAKFRHIQTTQDCRILFDNVEDLNNIDTIVSEES